MSGSGESADLAALALAALACLSESGPPAGWKPAMLVPCVAQLRRTPDSADRPLIDTAAALGLDDAELLAVALCLAVDRDPHAARVLTALQRPLGTSRPLLGIAALALAPLGASVVGLACGRAVAAGLIVIGDEAAALSERSIAIPLPIVAALHGKAENWDGLRRLEPRDLALPTILLDEAGRRAGMLAARSRAGLVLRCSSRTEAIALALQIGESVGRELVLCEGPLPAGAGAWLVASGRMPLFMPILGPGDRWSRPAIPAYDGPWLAATGLDGAVDADPVADEWVIPMPALEDRVQLWRNGGASAAGARWAAERFRHGAGRIADIAGRAALRARHDGRRVATAEDIAGAVAEGSSPLSALAQRSRVFVADDALVLPPALRASLDMLVARARLRGALSEGLGPALTARYTPGVRALFVGEAGTGKTLAAHWLAGQLGLPLYRVDLASLSSKWIGETEKNLSAILSAAEHADVILFFDEADALFAARTSISDANDRFANAQTNYLLQRIEEYEGIAILASNSRDRFDPAFVRRLDTILDFPMPDAAARRELWLAHLGTGAVLEEAQLDRLAITVDLAGGHVRNVVLGAGVAAKSGGRPIGWTDLTDAIAAEYRKLGRPPPALPPC